MEHRSTGKMSLSQDEQLLLHLTAQGYDRQYVMDILGVSESTFYRRVSEIKRKLRTNNIVHSVSVAQANELIDVAVQAFKPLKHDYPTRLVEVSPWDSLTEREREIFAGLGDGRFTDLRDHEISALLYIETTSLKKHLSCMYKKLGVQCRSGAVRLATLAFIQQQEVDYAYT